VKDVPKPQSQIDGVIVKQLKVIPDERGWLMEMLRADDPFFQQFGQVYVSVAYPGVVKGWHYHKVQWDHFVIVKGMMKVVLYDIRDGSPTKGVLREYFMGEQNPILLRIPPGVLHGMKAIGTEPGMLVNCPSHPYDPKNPDEYRVHPHENDVPYDWSRKDG
jgi:dTDP-4-dehydrorhamnose 3,5-epimerase